MSIEMSKTAKSKHLHRIAVIGFGSQGRAHAIRLREVGKDVCVGLRTGSRSRPGARRLGFKIATPLRAVAQCDAVAIMVPDRLGASVLKELGPFIGAGALVVFAAGYPLVFPKQKKFADLWTGKRTATGKAPLARDFLAEFTKDLEKMGVATVAEVKRIRKRSIQKCKSMVDFPKDSVTQLPTWRDS